jgi:hypothetical protein
MEILPLTWLESEPHDYEYKKYKLLGAANLYGSLIKDNQLNSVLLEIESHLELLYKFQHEKDILDDRMKVLKGIDLDNMELEYEYPEHSPELDCVIKLSGDAVLVFEKLYKALREKWRENEKHIELTHIPSKNPIYTHGYLLVLDYNTNIIIYKFEKPSKLNDNWRNFRLKHVDTIEYTLDKLSDFVTSITAAESKATIIRCDFKKNMHYEECALPLTQFKLFHNLKTG